jgi:hypothetical protein
MMTQGLLNAMFYLASMSDKSKVFYKNELDGILDQKNYD